MIKTNPPPRAKLTSRIFSAFCSVSYDICWHLDYTLIFYYMHKVLFYISPPPYWWVGGGLVTFRIAQKAKANYFIHTFCSVLGWDVRSVLTIMGRRLGWSNTLGCSTGNVSAALQLRRGQRCIASKPMSGKCRVKWSARTWPEIRRGIRIQLPSTVKIKHNGRTI